MLPQRFIFEVTFIINIQIRNMFDARAVMKKVVSRLQGAAEPCR